MSKSLKAIAAFLIIFLSITPIVSAQEDFEGITPIEEPAIDPVITQEPVAARDDRLNELKIEEKADIDNIKEKYKTLKQQAVDANTEDKLNVLLVSARYHRLVDLLYTYLIFAGQAIDANAEIGITAPGTENALNAIETELVGLSATVDEYDALYDQYITNASANLNTSDSDLKSAAYQKSIMMKAAFNIAKSNLLNLIRSAQ